MEGEGREEGSDQTRREEVVVEERDRQDTNGFFVLWFEDSVTFEEKAKGQIVRMWLTEDREIYKD